MKKNKIYRITFKFFNECVELWQDSVNEFDNYKEFSRALNRIMRGKQFMLLSTQIVTDYILGW